MTPKFCPLPNPTGFLVTDYRVTAETLAAEEN